MSSKPRGYLFVHQSICSWTVCNACCWLAKNYIYNILFIQGQYMVLPFLKSFVYLDQGSDLSVRLLSFHPSVWPSIFPSFRAIISSTYLMCQYLSRYLWICTCSNFRSILFTPHFIPILSLFQSGLLLRSSAAFRNFCPFEFPSTLLSRFLLLSAFHVSCHFLYFLSHLLLHYVSFSEAGKRSSNGFLTNPIPGLTFQ